VDEIVELGELDPESVVTPGIFVQRVVLVKSAIVTGTPAKEVR
jgi:3-oxoadipate CoA-transferase alpha subunit